MENEKTLYSWEEFQKELDKNGQFWKPELNVLYDIKIKSASPYSEIDEQTKKTRFKVKIELLSVDGEQSDKIWNTSSFPIIKKLMENVKDGSLSSNTYSVQKTQENGKFKYIFLVRKLKPDVVIKDTGTGEAML